MWSLRQPLSLTLVYRPETEQGWRRAGGKKSTVPPPAFRPITIRKIGTGGRGRQASVLWGAAPSAPSSSATRRGPETADCAGARRLAAARREAEAEVAPTSKGCLALVAPERSPPHGSRPGHPCRPGECPRGARPAGCPGAGHPCPAPCPRSPGTESCWEGPALGQRVCLCSCVKCARPRVCQRVFLGVWVYVYVCVVYRCFCVPVLGGLCQPVCPLVSVCLLCEFLCACDFKGVYLPVCLCVYF